MKTEDVKVELEGLKMKSDSERSSEGSNHMKLQTENELQNLNTETNDDAVQPFASLIRHDREDTLPLGQEFRLRKSPHFQRIQ